MTLLPSSAPSLDRDSPVPLYHQLKRILRSRVENGEWKPGDQIPTETELSEQYQVSKITVKEALSGLVIEGLLYRRQGKGTFVQTPKIEQEPQRLTSFSEQMQQRGLRPGAAPLSQQVVAATERVAEQLGLPPGEPVVQITRLRLADDEPMGIQTSHIPHSRCPQLSAVMLGPGSLYEFLQQNGIRPVSAIERYEIVLVDDYEAELLKVAPGAPAFLVERVAYDQAGVAIEYAKSVMRGDRYVVTVILDSEGGSTKVGGRIKAAPAPP